VGAATAALAVIALVVLLTASSGHSHTATASDFTPGVTLVDGLSGAKWGVQKIDRGSRLCLKAGRLDHSVQTVCVRRPKGHHYAVLVAREYHVSGAPCRSDRCSGNLEELFYGFIPDSGAVEYLTPQTHSIPTDPIDAPHGVYIMTDPLSIPGAPPIASLLPGAKALVLANQGFCPLQPGHDGIIVGELHCSATIKPGRA
jgi:hypothetical protein